MPLLPVTKQVGLLSSLRNQVHHIPGTNSIIDLRYSADPLKTVSGPKHVPLFRSSSNSIVPAAWITELLV